MFHTSRAIIVEGKYDKIRLSALTDALILTTDGFGIFSDKEKQRFIKKTAREKGLMIITDSDAAGFRIRHYIENIAGSADILNVFIPDLYGKESRKTQASKEGKLGVEGMPTQTLEEALRRSGAFDESNTAAADPITYTDLYDALENGKIDASTSGIKGEMCLSELQELLDDLDNLQSVKKTDEYFQQVEIKNKNILKGRQQ